MPELRLSGCRTQPLLSYLKALGILRVVAEQADEDAAGRWGNGVFELRSALSEDELIEFFLDRYEPAPVVSPWNGGSGFFPDSNREPRETLNAIEQTTDSRFQRLRGVVELSRAALERLGVTTKPGDKREVKARLVRELRRTLPDEALPWLDAAIVGAGSDLRFPPLLGSGGVDGNSDLGFNYMKAVLAVLDSDRQAEARVLLEAAIFAKPARLVRGVNFAHLQRDHSPTNSAVGKASSGSNPWDLIVGLEGSLTLCAAIGRRHGHQIPGNLVAPFTVASTAAGYGSATAEEVAGSSELWLPLWSKWATLPELLLVTRESRAQVRTGSGIRSVRSGLDFARAAGELGVARGIHQFERYALTNRAGRDRLAVPAGRISVRAHSRASTLAELDQWLRRVLGSTARGECPRAVSAAARAVERAAFQLAVRDDAESCLELVGSLGQLEEQLARSAEWATKKGIPPTRGLTSRVWLDAADDGTAEFAIAAGLASLGAAGQAPSLRDYLHGTAPPSDRARRAFDERRSHAISANSQIAVLAKIHARRHLDAERGNRAPRWEGNETAANGSGGSRPQTQLSFDFGAWCDLDAARRFAAGMLDDERILELAKGLCLLDYRSSPRSSVKPAEDGPLAVPSFDLLALAWAPQAPRDDEQSAKETNDSKGSGADREARGALGARPGWAAKLSAGATGPVVRDACLRLQLAGLPPLPRREDLLAGAPPGSRLAAALLLRIGRRDLNRLAQHLTTWNEDELTTTTETEDSDARRPH